jgi:hypothetical protein
MEAAVPVAKRRGRPRKILSPEQEHFGASKRRGRPRKVISPGQEDAGTEMDNRKAHRAGRVRKKRAEEREDGLKKKRNGSRSRTPRGGK